MDVDAVITAMKEDAAGSLSCFSCAAAEMDVATAAAVPLSGSYLSCAAVETASKSTSSI